MSIFVSYSRHDEKAVKALAQGFESARRPVWLDADLSGGDAWWDKILHNIRSCSVFLFALSESSWQSKPCRLELDYATALNRPIVPVQVGEVRNLRAIPLARLQIVGYRVDDANAGFEVLSAVDAAARRAGPLPVPPPPEPPIPYAYLLALGRQIDAREMDPREQMGVVDQLRKALGEEEDSVRQDILAMLERLKAKPWVTRQTEREIKAVLFANSAENETPAAGPAPTPGPEAAEPPQPTPPPPPPSAEPDGRAIFERRMAELRTRQEAEQRRQAEQRAWQETPVSSPWGGVSSGGAASHGTWGGVTTPTPQPSPEPQPQPRFQPTQFQPTQLQSFVPQQFTPGGQAMGQPVAPPNYLGLSIIGFVLNFLFGGIALYFSHQVGQRFAAHDHAGAQRASANARTFAIVGIVVGILFFLILVGAEG